MPDGHDRIRVAATAFLVGLVLVLAHYSAWFAARLPAVLHPHPLDTAVMIAILTALALWCTWRAWKERRVESPFDVVLHHRGLVAFCLAMGAFGEALSLAFTFAGIPCSAHASAVLIAAGVAGGPLLMSRVMPAPSKKGHPWAHALDEAHREAAQLRNAPAEVPPTVERPAFLREVANPGVRFCDVVGLASAKRDVAESIRLMADPATAQRHGIEPVRGVLLHGPPGTGKTFFARAAAGEFGKRFLEVRASDLVSQYVGETEKNIAAAFDYARAVAPCILFFDEIDGLARSRALALNDWEISRVNALLTEMDGLTKDARAPIVIAATNRIDDLDPAVLRPGRFDRKILVGLPGASDRAHLLRALLRGAPLAPDFPMPWLVEATAGMSPAELKSLVQDVRRGIYREGRAHPRPASARDFQSALATARTQAIQVA
jgi:AAA+ superfamily predicted ATPase